MKKLVKRARISTPPENPLARRFKRHQLFPARMDESSFACSITRGARECFQPDLHGQVTRVASRQSFSKTVSGRR
jgi:hypothetical protein